MLAPLYEFHGSTRYIYTGMYGVVNNLSVQHENTTGSEGADTTCE
jgi:hypothetical protein